MKSRLDQTHLTVYLGGNCNLRCSYCYSAAASGTGADEKAVLASLDFFLAAATASAKVTFLGGEPLLHGGLLKKAVQRIRASAPDMPVTVFTNGTLLTPDWLYFFGAQRIKLTVSLDGGKSANDASRRFRAGKDSVFLSVLRRLPAGARSSAAVSMVVTPRAAAGLASNISRLKALGFNSIAWVPDLTALWRKRDILTLKKAALRAQLGYFRALRRGRAPYEVANIYEAVNEALTGERCSSCLNLTLGPDGNFYPCDKLLSAPDALRRRYAMRPGSACLSFSKGKKFFSEAAAAGFSPSAGACSIATWVFSSFCRRSPASGRGAFLAGHSEVGVFLAAWLASLASGGLKAPAFRKLHSRP